MSSILIRAGAGSRESSNTSMYGSSLSLDLSALSGFKDSTSRSGTATNDGKIVKYTTFDVEGTRVFLQLTIDCLPHAIHHEILLLWNGESPLSQTPNRHVLLSIDVSQQGSKYEKTSISAKHGAGQWKTAIIGCETGKPFAVRKKASPITPKQEVAHAHKVMAIERVFALAKMDHAWKQEVVVLDMEPAVKKFLIKPLTSMYVEVAVEDQ